MKRASLLLAVFSAAALFCLWWWWRDGHPVQIADAPVGKLDCVSYTPSRDRPLSQGSVSRAQLEHDLGLLAQRFRCVRIYSVSNGLDQVPVVARPLNLRVLLGFWIGADSIHNQREIKLGLATAEREKDVIDGIIVGNEVLLRRELTAVQLGALLRQVNAATTIPVTYADVWDFWKANPTLAPDADFITIHLLPYWDDKPTGIDAAIAHTAQVYAEAMQTFAGKRILIGETGWPSRGRQRDDATPGHVAQARFVREFTTWAEGNAVPYNLIEAFDQPWKRAQEGTVGGYWGMYDAAGKPKFPLQGEVTEDPAWHRVIWGAGAGALLFALLGLFARRPGSTPAAGSTIALLYTNLAGALAGSVVLLQWRYLLAANRTLTEWVATGAVVLIGWLIFLQAVLLLAAADRGERELPRVPGVAAALGRLQRRGAEPADPVLAGEARGLGLLRFLLLLSFAYLCLGLAFDSRYRDFPLSLYALPVMVLCLLSACTPGGGGARLRSMAEETLLAGGLIVCAAVICVLEGPKNFPALAFGGLAVALGGSVFYGARGFTGHDERTQ